MRDTEPVERNIQDFLSIVCKRSHRQLIVISGRHEWCQSQIFSLNTSVIKGETLWIGEIESGLVPPGKLKPVSAKQTHQLLGRESHCIFFDCWSGFNPNGFGQVAGTLVAGGCFILITPPFPEWQDFDDPEYQHIAVDPYTPGDVGRRFVQHLQQTIMNDRDLIHIAEGQVFPALEPLSETALNDITGQPDLAGHTAVSAPFRTSDQQDTVEQCLKIIQQQRGVIVLTADRGRGKSAALGLVAVNLMKNEVSNTSFKENSQLEIILTAPSRGAVQSVVMMLQALLPASQLVSERDSWTFGRTRLRFMLPDLLTQQRPDADLLLVDEAAAIPAPVLLSLLDFPRIIFASTLHGYEGTGQGFAVRFMPSLDRLVPDRQHLRMQQPVRWADNDPLEAFTYKALLLDAEPAAVDPERLKHSGLSFRKLNRDELVADTALLKQLFGLLILAHYRTTPGDLRILLDSPNIEIWAGFTGQNGESCLIATALLAYEGPIEADLAQAIIDGKRRPKGQLIPQTLLAHCHIPEAAGCRGLRVMRIAVHPQLQRRRIGSRLLQAVEQGHRDIDWFGTSFGATEDLCRFWQQFGMRLQRLGHNRDKVSGTYAAVMLRGITPAGTTLQRKGCLKAREQLDGLSGSEPGKLNADLLEALTSDQQGAYAGS